MMLLTLGTVGVVQADDAPATVTKAIETQGFSVTSPMETGITAFYFPSNKTIAGGIAETVLRVKWTDVDFPTLSKITTDLDVNIAKEVNESKGTLYGPGLKLNYDVDMVNDSGFTFKPSIGLTALRNIEGLNTATDVLKNWRLAIYGNIVLYKF